MILQHVDKPFFAVIIMKERWVKSRGVDVDRIRPWALDAICCDDVVWRIFEGTIFALNIRVNQPEPFTVMGKTRSPDAFKPCFVSRFPVRYWSGAFTATVRVATHIKLTLPLQRPSHKLPVCQILGMINQNSWVPFKC